MKGKICLVTGATAGAGYDKAQALAVAGATVLVVGRTPERCALAVERIRTETDNDDVQFFAADFASQAQIADLAGEIGRRYERLDMLVHGTRKIYPTRRETPDGVEMTFAVNYLASFALTRHLLRLLQAAPAAHIDPMIDTHAAVDLNDLHSVADYDGERAYARSQGALLLFGAELARRLAGTPVTVDLQPDANTVQDDAAALWAASEQLAFTSRELKAEL